MTHLTRLSLLLVGLGIASMLGACNIVAPIVYATAPEPEVKAEFTLQDRPTVVFIDDRSNVMNPAALRRVLADRITEKFITEEALLQENAIRPRDALAVAQSRDRSGNLMSITAIGDAVGAEQIIYVEMKAMTLTIDGVQPKPGAVAHVKVIDVATGERLFPAKQEGQTEMALKPVKRVMDAVDQELYKSRATRLKVLEMLTHELGDDIAGLFFDHLPRDHVGSNLR